jgi:microcystin-dependent protein
MDQFVAFSRNDVLPSYVMNVIARAISTAARGFRLTLPNDTTVRVPAGAGEQAAVVFIDGLPRWAESNVDRAHLGGAAATYRVWATAAAQNVVNSPLPNTDDTNYAFDLAITPLATEPTAVAGVVDVWREVGRLTWDGTKITALEPWVHDHRPTDPLTPTSPRPHVTPLRAKGAAGQTAPVLRVEDSAGTVVLDVGPSQVRIPSGAGAGLVAVSDASGNVSWAMLGAASLAADSVGTDELAPGAVTNAEVSASAAIAESKLALASDAAAGTASRRTLGPGATQAAPGNDARFPAGADIVDADIGAAAAIAESKLALASDAAAGTASRRTLGTGATQATAGNDARLSDQRVPTDGSVTAAKVAAALKPSGGAAAGTEALRALGATASTAAAGNDSRLSDQRVPTDGSVTLAKLAAEVADRLLPAGTIAATARSTASTGWLLCEGQAVSRTGATAALFAAIGTTYGAGDGSTTFNLPDLRGRVPVGVDGAAGRLSASDALGQSAGAETHTLTIAEMPAHDHPNVGGGAGPYIRNTTTTQGTTGTSPATFAASVSTVEVQGGGAAHNNLQPYQVVNWMIKT